MSSSRFETNAMWEPLGLHEGDESPALAVVSFRTAPVTRSFTTMSALPRFSSMSYVATV